jgi:hypothetical protein
MKRLRYFILSDKNKLIVIRLMSPTEQYLANCPKLLKLRWFNPPSTKLSNRSMEKLTVKGRQSSQNRWDGNTQSFHNNKDL